MSKTNDVKNALCNAVEGATGKPCFYERAELSTAYPYSVLEFQRLSDTEGVERYTLEVNVWDKYATYSRVNAIADALERELDKTVLNIDTAVITVHKDGRQIVDDEDKAIRRIRLQMELIIISKE